MNTLIIPCGGKSSRFPNMKPKYLLTHPDGHLMIEKSIAKLNLEIFDRIIITIVRQHCEEYEADIILEQVFKDNSKVEIFILDDFTSTVCETVYLTLTKMNVNGHFVIKDCDCMVHIDLPQKIKNAVVGYDLYIHKNVENIAAKSFLIVNEQNTICDIIEKNIVSDKICLGVYCFEDVNDFKNAYLEIINSNILGEIYISHIISYILKNKNQIFEAYWATDYSDWGTLPEWKNEQRKYRTYFVDIDGIIFKNSGQYGKINWSNNSRYIEANIEALMKLASEGAQIVLTTSRPERYRNSLQDILDHIGLKPFAILMGLNHSQRIIINDFAPTNPYPSARAISLPRNGNINEYLE